MPAAHVSIGHDTWIGHGVVIMHGVRIGNGAVVGSNAVVTKDVAPYTIVGGVAAKVLRQRFPRAIAQGLKPQRGGIGTTPHSPNARRIFATCALFWPSTRPNSPGSKSSKFHALTFMLRLRSAPSHESQFFHVNS
jgi:hypothetical protein